MALDRLWRARRNAGFAWGGASRAVRIGGDKQPRAPVVPAHAGATAHSIEMWLMHLEDQAGVDRDKLVRRV